MHFLIFELMFETSKKQFYNVHCGDHIFHSMWSLLTQNMPKGYYYGTILWKHHFLLMKTVRNWAPANFVFIILTFLSLGKTKPAIPVKQCNLYGPQYTGMMWAKPVWPSPYQYGGGHTGNGMVGTIPVWWGPYRFDNLTGMAPSIPVWPIHFIFQAENVCKGR